MPVGAVDGAATALWQISLSLGRWDLLAPRGLDVYRLSLLFETQRDYDDEPNARTGRGFEAGCSRHSLEPGLSRQFLFPTFPRLWRLSALSLSP